MASDSIILPKITRQSNGSSEHKSFAGSRNSSWNSVSLGDSGVDVLEPKLRAVERPPASGQGLLKLKDDQVNEDRDEIASPVPPPQHMRKRTAVVRMTKADLEKKEATIITLQNKNSKLQSQRRVLEQKSSSLEEVRECFGTVCGLLGVSPEGVFSTSVQQAVMEKVKILMASSKESAVEVLSLNEKLEELLGETAQEKERANHMTSELERCKCSLREAEKEGELAKTEKERLRQTLARTSAQFESNRKRMKDLEEKQSKSLPAIDHNSCEEVSKLRQHLSDMELQLQDLQDSYAGKDASIQALQQQLASSQDLLGEFLDELSAQLGLVEQDTTPNSCMQQILALKNENTKLTKSLKMADEQRLVAEAGAKANRETILRLVSEAKEHESRLQRLAKLEQERDLAFASKVSAEHDREELSRELARVCERVKEMEELSLVQGRQVDAVRDELERCQLNLSTQEQQYAELVGGVRGAVGCHPQNTKEVLADIMKEREDIATVKGRLSELESDLATSEQAVVELSLSLAKQEEEVKRKEEVVEGLQQEVDTCHSQITALETSLGKLRLQEVQQDAFYQRVARAMKMDQTTVDMLSGDFAVDAIIARAEQLALRETREVSEKQVCIYKLQRKLKATTQVLDSKALHITLLQKKLERLEERLSSYSRPQTRQTERKAK